MPFIVSTSKSQPAVRNVAMYFISAVVLPVPPTLVLCPEVSVSQNELVISPGSPYPVSPPTKLLPLTEPTEPVE